MSDYIQQNIAEWRFKVANGTITTEESRAIVQHIRDKRIAAGGVSAASREKKATAAKKKEPINSDDLLSQLEGL